MAYQKLQQESAILVTPSDDAPIPNPAAPQTSGRCTAAVATTFDADFRKETGTVGALAPATGVTVLTDAAATFITAGVQPNDLVVNVTALPDIQCRVQAVISEQQLQLWAQSPNDLNLIAEINNPGDNYEVREANNFVDANFSEGDIVVNTTAGTSTLISTIGTYNQARCLTGVVLLGNFFTVYQSNNGAENTGCILYVGDTSAGGDIRVTTAAGQVITYTDVPQGIWMPIQVTKVWATGTQATDIIAQW